MNSPQISIIINFEVEGLHYWLEAENLFPEVGYLSDLHRHIFHISCIKEVTHTDRDIEIIKFKRQVKDYLETIYFDTDYDCCNFGKMSCEEIALKLFEYFDLTSCTVLEDGENGAKINL